MSAPNNRQVIEALRATLQTIESTRDPGRDKDAVERLRQILLARITELELRETLTSSDEELSS
jgi:hypothetical protein